MRPGRHHPRRRLGARRDDPAAAGHPRRRSCRRSTPPGPALALPGDPTRGGCSSLDRERAGELSRRRRRRLPGAARPLRRGRHHPGPARAGRRALRRRRACSPARPAWTRSSPRSCSPPTACRSVTTSVLRARGRDARRDAERDAARPTRVRQARPGRLVARHHQGRRRGTSSTPRSPRPAAHDPKVLVEARGRRPRDRVRRAGAARRHARGRRSRPRSAWSATHEFYDFDAKYLDDAREFDIPAELADDVARAAAGRWRSAAFRGSRLRRAWPASTSSSTAGRRRRVNEINTMPGLHRRSRCTRGCGRPPASTTRRCWRR